MLSDIPRQILEEGATKVGLANALPILLEYATEAILLETKVAPTPLKLGQSRLAGRPDLPALFDWPKDAQGDELPFVAQINLEELPACSVRGLLPEQGHAYFFCTRDGEFHAVYYPGNDLIAVDQTFSAPPEEVGFWKTVYIPRKRGFRLCELRFRAIPSLPQWNQPGYTSLRAKLNLGPDDEALVDLHSFICSKSGADYPTKLLGFADQITDGDLGFQAQTALEKSMNPGAPTLHLTRMRQHKLAEDWMLLFQLASDDEAHMDWGNGGCCYFMIRKADLAAGKFDNVKGIIERG